MTEALENIAITATEIAKPSVGDLALDIGCNDGTLLRSYKLSGLRRIGFEPAKNLVEDARRETDYIFNDFFGFDQFRKKFPDSKAKIVTSIAMFYDLDDPTTFVIDVSKILDPNGVWVIQQNYLPTMLEQNGFDNIGHEHLTYYSLQTLDTLLNEQDLEIFDVETNQVNGGSFRTYISHRDRFPVRESVAGLKQYEKKLFSRRPSIYIEFAKNVRMVGSQLRMFVTKEARDGKRIYVYGASTRGNTILQYCKLNHDLIEKATDANPEKWGRKTPGTGIPIVSKEEARKDKPDYFLVLPHHFLDEIRRQENDYLRSGGKFIVPLPKFRIVTQGAKHLEYTPKKFNPRS
jgi:NDP-4-keto-2,6-dideoxyhexose 3-C-methyltransferase